MQAIIDTVISLDVVIMHFMNGAVRNPVFNWLMPLFDNDHAWLLPMIAAWVGLMIFGNRRSRWVGIGALAIVALTDPLSSRIIKPLASRIRPCNLLEGLNVWTNGAWIVLPDPVIEIYRGSYSFPSSHAVNTGAQALWFGRAYPRAKWLWYGLAGVIGFSRVYIGVHWPSDVIAGWMVGAMCFCVVWLIWVRFVPGFPTGGGSGASIKPPEDNVGGNA